jgi:HKD family nuclease
MWFKGNGCFRCAKLTSTELLKNYFFSFEDASFETLRMSSISLHDSAVVPDAEWRLQYIVEFEMDKDYLKMVKRKLPLFTSF